MELKGTTKHVLAFLSFYMDENGCSCFPSQRTLAVGAGLSRPAVDKHLKIGARRGWIEIIEGSGKGQGYKRHSYEAKIPENLANEVYQVIDELGQPGLPSNKKTWPTSRDNLANDVSLSTSKNTSYSSVPEKNLKKQKSIKPGNSKKHKSEAKIQNPAAVEIYEFYLKEIAPENKNKQISLHNISKHLERYSKADLTKAITNYKSEAKGREPGYRKTPSNFFGIKTGNEYFMDYLPGGFENQKAEELETIRSPREITMENVSELYAD